MKRGILIVAMVLGTVATFGQTKSVSLSEAKVGTVSIEHKLSINMEDNDTLQYVYFGFRNSKYTTIVDIISYMFTSQQQVDEFKEALKAALPEIKAKSNITWKKEKFYMNVYDFTNTIYLNELKGSGNTQITYKQTEKIIAYLETVKF